MTGQTGAHDGATSGLPAHIIMARRSALAIRAPKL